LYHSLTISNTCHSVLRLLYQEVDIFTECPGFNLETFRELHPGRWLAETGIGVGARYQEKI